LVVLTAFAVVLATLVVQGLTLAPLIRRLRLDQIEDPAGNLADARRTLARVGLEEIDALGARNDLALRDLYALKCAASPLPSMAERLDGYRQLGLAVVGAQRKALLRLRDEQQIDIDAYYLLQEEIDWRELTLFPDSQRRIDEV
jgi:NhaP-type Na+/H+ or K+/H+ antiporter